MHMSKDDQEARILAQINELQKKGTALRMEEEAELNQHDRNKIKVHKIIYTGVYLLAVFIVTGFVDGLLSFFTDLDTLPYWHVGLTALVAVSFGLFYFRFMKQLEVCVRAGKKKVIRGIVTRKYTKNVNRRLYVVEIDSLPVFLQQARYHEYKPGDGIEVHLLPLRHPLHLYDARLNSMALQL